MGDEDVVVSKGEPPACREWQVVPEFTLSEAEGLRTTIIPLLVETVQHETTY